MDLMDRQKTIELLEELKAKDPFDRYEKQNIGIDWAIDAIKAASSVQTCEDAVSRQAAIDECNKRGAEHIGYAISHLPSVQPQREELTPEEAASEIASGSIMSARYWLDAMIRLKQMGYAICRKR